MCVYMCAYFSSLETNSNSFFGQQASCILIVLKAVVYRKTKQYPNTLILLTAGGNESSGAVECCTVGVFHWNKTCPLEISDGEKT